LAIAVNGATWFGIWYALESRVKKARKKTPG